MFQPGTPGKPRGVKNKIASTVLKDFLDVWNEPVKEGSTLTTGRAVLLTMYRERPHEFAKLGAAFVPREFVFENVVTELDDDKLHQMIGVLREQLRLAQEASPPA